VGNQFVKDMECVPCRDGLVRPAGDFAAAGDTECDTPYTLVLRQTISDPVESGDYFTEDTLNLNGNEEVTASFPKQYSIMDQVQNYVNVDGGYKFKIRYPRAATEWSGESGPVEIVFKQSENPATTNGPSDTSTGKMAGFELLPDESTSSGAYVNAFVGLMLDEKALHYPGSDKVDERKCIMKGSSSSYNLPTYYYCLGALTGYFSTSGNGNGWIQGPKSGFATSVVELYVKQDLLAKYPDFYHPVHAASGNATQGNASQGNASQGNASQGNATEAKND